MPWPALSVSPPPLSFFSRAFSTSSLKCARAYAYHHACTSPNPTSTQVALVGVGATLLFAPFFCFFVLGLVSPESRAGPSWGPYCIFCGVAAFLFFPPRMAQRAYTPLFYFTVSAITPVPHHVRVRQAPSILVVASDGVWDSMTQENVSKLVR